ncbi:MAG TPA: 4Fe-4S dicluster domain-containing protein [Stellaceae bacterium]|nr:4Fe-4S dicluster domain-containing protein [Stellaceae bacterium]
MTDLDRRRLMQLVAASAALVGLSGCGPSETPEHMTPRVDQAPGETPGEASYVATAVVQEGYATGVILQHRMARPVKLEGNPDHPASLGAADAPMQATVLDLYDPGRSSAVISGGQIADWNKLALVLAQRRGQWVKDGGAGLRILTGRVTSPSLSAQLAALTKQYPAARWHQWERLSRDNAAAGARLAFGKPVDTLPRFDKADVVLGIESDAISAAPGHLGFARAFAARRRAVETGSGKMNRVYAVEATPTLFGAASDHRFALKPLEIEIALRAIAAACGAGPAEWRSADRPAWSVAIADDLAAHKGAALVHAGPEQSPAIHALVHAINTAIAAPVRHIDPVAEDAAGLSELAAEMHDGKVDTLLIAGTNPVYDAPSDLGFAEALKRVVLSIELATHVDETARAATFHVPALHMFEDWADARAFDGTATILQPQIRPLVPGRSAAEMLALLAGTDNFTTRGFVEDYWRERASGDFAADWTGWLRKGVIDDTTAAETAVAIRPDFATALPQPARSDPGITVLLRPDPFLRDGAQANNGWLQELPRPLTRLTWGNAALLAPATAGRLRIDDGDVVEITVGNGRVRIPAMGMPGQTEDVITLSLGYGRKAIGAVGESVGGDAGPLRAAAALWQVDRATIRTTGGHEILATTQGHQTMDGRDIVRTVAVDDVPKAASPPEQSSLYSKYPPGTDAWGMAISLSSCIGCGACTAACQAENNIPVVGREQVIAERSMHWIRVDRYWKESAAKPDIMFQPVPCMHCEDAPCEVVCPVGATMHDTDGLNVMVYNRCVGTRFCSNNCPYKVRRFNFFPYAARDPRPAVSWNPDVTVRSRGVMEKCTYCIQRIREAKIAGDRDNRPLADGEVKTACQQACPTEAIVFGDLKDSDSEVRKRKSSPLDYALLEELNTRPRTTYASRVLNRNPDIAES